MGRFFRLHLSLIHIYRVWGLITQPRSCRASRSMQYFYINGRYVRNRTMMVDIDIHKVSGHFQKQDSSRELALHRGAFKPVSYTHLDVYKRQQTR